MRARDNDREQRHTKLSFPTGYRVMQKEKVIYATDMLIGFGQGITNIGVSPCHDLGWKSNYLYADLKLPIDRVPGTPMLMRGVYCMSDGGGNVAFYVDLLVVGKGDDVTSAVGRFWLISAASPAYIQNVTPTATIEAVKLEGYSPSVDFQLQIGRDADNVLDTTVESFYLFKLIFEYTGYA